MANEMYTNRFGKQVPVPDITVPKSIMTSLMRLQEDYAVKGRNYKLTGVVLEILILGIKARRNTMRYAETTKDNKAIAQYIKAQLQANLPIDREYIAKLSGVQSKQDSEVQGYELDGEIITDESETDMSNEALDAATQPSN